MPQKEKSATRKYVPVAIAILAGGLSTRMGRDKAQVRLGQRTLLRHVRATAQLLGLPTRVIRRDVVPSCGPLAGIYTALVSSVAEAELFLSCDMPFVSEQLLREIIQRSKFGQRPVCVAGAGRVGFPLILPRRCKEVVKRRIESRDLSVQSLVRGVRAVRVKGTPRELANINTPQDLAAAREMSRKARTVARR